MYIKELLEFKIISVLPFLGFEISSGFLSFCLNYLGQFAKDLSLLEICKKWGFPIFSYLGIGFEYLVGLALEEPASESLY